MHVGSKYTEIYFCFGNDNMLTGTRLRVGKLLHEKVNEYLEKLKNFMPTKDRCLYSHCYFVLHSHPFKAHEQMKLDQTLYIIVTSPSLTKYSCGAKCGKECLKNIESGKCIDPFVRGYIGKKFYAGTYMLTNNYIDNNKQRE